ncbi:molybdopterin-guanine dinucleotide biosynthesis protein B [Bacillus sp. RAR_GA_16]|uniref:molybdopterin-guanine dinucleotide biosynthesis protein B n=1 Tax=Bacillus sp. RAR_GA_16 TaxID=2876774 RepID=UPI001CCA86E8|nr:molybdopterin-guanine dinucleotide biosynthesis protein B [Bacillus sp. RAR_GA_16]MCA0172329.1 molybdopterin-guanine dinucleotide biosynthesis protein B [Bacillus sp. RAR_GA_16]
MVKTPVIQVVGYQNSGKTLFAEKFIKEATAQGIKVGVIKHHGHGTPEVYDQKKDSGRHRKAGAVVTGVSGGGMISVQATKENEWELEQLVRLYDSFDLDLILVEGFKEERFPKIVLLRDKDDMNLLNKKHVIGTIMKEILDVPIDHSYHYDQMNDCIEDVLKDVRRG